MGETNPDAYFYHLGRGKLLERQQSYPSAAQSFERAIQVDSAKPDAHYHLAVILRRLGETTRANEEFKIFTTLQAQTRRPYGRRDGSHSASLA